jgi:hypothetical protein
MSGGRACRMGGCRTSDSPQGARGAGVLQSPSRLRKRQVIAPCSQAASSFSSGSIEPPCRGCCAHCSDGFAVSSHRAPNTRWSVFERMVLFAAACFHSCACVSATRFIPAALTYLLTQRRPAGRSQGSQKCSRPGLSRCERSAEGTWIAVRLYVGC